MAGRIFASMAFRRSLQLRSSPLKAMPAFHFISCSFNVFCKVSAQKPDFTLPNEMRNIFPRGCLWIHTNQWRNMPHEAMETAESSGSGTSFDESGKTKMKRKKLKGKRAVVRWLKSFRWKKKKEYERMTSEEKILYKLRKARKKEARLAEALKKIEPPTSAEATHDPEILTPEEHFYYLKMGHKCKNYVPIGIRGISQGVILNMHLHWKKHQTLKVIVKTFTPEEVKEIAVDLARLSGGIVLDIHEGNTIIMYRGKNYSQPPTEIMSPKIALSRRKALDKAKTRDSLRAVRAYIPRLEQDLDLLPKQAKAGRENKIVTTNENNQPIVNVDDYEEVSGHPFGHSGVFGEIMPEDTDSSVDDSSVEESGLISDSESLSDIFETDSDSETKVERPLFLNTFEKFHMDDNREADDFEENLRSISMESKKANLQGKDLELSELDEVDRMFLRAGSLLRKNRR